MFSKSDGFIRYCASACSTTHQTRENCENWPAICEPKNVCIVWKASATATPSTSALLRSRSTNSCCVAARYVVDTPASSGRSRAFATNASTARPVARGSPEPRFCT